MVRRWSYLNYKQNAVFDVSSKSLETSIENHAFKVFKKTTFFRKYNKGIASFVRRKNILRKRKTNNIILNYITTKWVTFYLRARRLYRYIQSSFIFSIARAIASVDSFNSKSKIFGFITGATITSISKRSSKVLIANAFYNSRNATVYLPNTIDKQDTLLSNVLFSSYISSKHNFYNLTNFNSVDFINSMSLLLYKQVMKSIILLRSIIITCSLLNIFKCS